MSSGGGATGLSKSQKKKLKKKRAAERSEHEEATDAPADTSSAVAATAAPAAGASQSGVVATTPSAGATASTGSGSASFTTEEEILWCVQQLQLGLRGLKKAQHAQGAEALKLINTLQSPKVPLPKKRMLMRGHFGDYRAKMRAAFKAQTVAANPEIAVKVADKKAQAAGMFVRRARHIQGSAGAVEGTEPEAAVSTEAKNEPFRFNFSAE